MGGKEGWLVVRADAFISSIRNLEGGDCNPRTSGQEQQRPSVVALVVIYSRWAYSQRLTNIVVGTLPRSRIGPT